MTIPQKYELLILAAPEITQDETKDLEKQLEALIKERKGSSSSFERWGKYRLAYPVRKNEYGVYFLARFEVPETDNLNKDIRSFLRIKFDTAVMRNLLTALPAQAPFEYHRPRSLEEAAPSESSLLKTKKIEGLISAVDVTRGSRKDAPRTHVVDDVDDTFVEEDIDLSPTE